MQYDFANNVNHVLSYTPITVKPEGAGDGWEAGEARGENLTFRRIFVRDLHPGGLETSVKSVESNHFYRFISLHSTPSLTRRCRSYIAREQDGQSDKSSQNICKDMRGVSAEYTALPVHCIQFLGNT